VNHDRSFAYLDPTPSLDYSAYVPRMAKLGLDSYKKTLAVIQRRIAKIGHLLPESGTVLEIGAADAAFLCRAQEKRPDLMYAAVEPDMNTLDVRRKLHWLASFATLKDAAAAGWKADLVCLFQSSNTLPILPAFLRRCAECSHRRERS
jgi:hypothetical protein